MIQDSTGEDQANPDPQDNTINQNDDHQESNNSSNQNVDTPAQNKDPQDETVTSQSQTEEAGINGEASENDNSNS